MKWKTEEKYKTVVLRCQSLLGKPELRTPVSISPFKIVGSIALFISELISHIAHLKHA